MPATNCRSVALAAAGSLGRTCKEAKAPDAGLTKSAAKAQIIYPEVHVSKYLLIMLSSLLGPAALAANGYDGSKQSTVAHARPLIEAYLAQKSTEFGVDLTPDQNGYHVRRSPAELVNWLAWPIVGGTRHDYTCRPIDVSLPAVAKTARFYLRTTYGADAGSLTHRYGEPHFSLVRGCSLGALSLEPDLILWPRTKRLFDDDEIVAITRSLVERVRPDATDFRHEVPSREASWDVPDLFDTPFDEPVEDCRRVSFARPGSDQRVNLGVLIRYDHQKLSPKFPLELQTIHKDPKSLRTFRMILVRSCYGMNLMRPASLDE